jgi:hypothetical protein
MSPAFVEFPGLIPGQEFKEPKPQFLQIDGFGEERPVFCPGIFQMSCPGKNPGSPDGQTAYHDPIAAFSYSAEQFPGIGDIAISHNRDM